ncbi:bifunctional phosphoribosyl-AMP cyclohydrolase/phosphoribosyl-ATP diphosphatase HisIE [Nitrospira defluvii]|uniref:Histidine biosynthesis bifunctional protein HisIE n=1 Tax=Nitrospira defluvii TaxID=330214 RepID=A0ABN7KH61_9BACT|nr:bifunctional phosphoribosyl-AMP cyclohydrolase/phosphoribosyl-ATP diphosphatase HisIE [Nitrospira defluvii]CAE6693121.1 Phosphoribosyl-AMP cyclohydrolase / Phosphoribosyl-ATP pyrophosphatase [Nitrospira defluvii]
MTQDRRDLTFDRQGLLPAVIQDWLDGTVLMVGFMNQQAITKTLETRFVHFWSRSRQTLWQKGESSGHVLRVKDLFVDCDHDTILVKVEPVGPTCHTGERACFFARMTEQGQAGETKTQDAGGGILERIYQTILERKATPQPDSYVSKLLQGGADRILKKVAEEAGEVIIAAKNGKREEIVYETADLLFHTLLVLGYHDVTLGDVYRELGSRFGKSGIRPEPGGRAGG